MKRSVETEVETDGPRDRGNRVFLRQDQIAALPRRFRLYSVVHIALFWRKPNLITPAHGCDSSTSLCKFSGHVLMPTWRTAESQPLIGHTSKLSSQSLQEYQSS